MLAALPEVTGAVVVHDHTIEAYLVLAEGAEASAVEREITTRLAAYKRPRRLHVVKELPRTTTGKLVRDRTVLRDVGPSASVTPAAPARTPTVEGVGSDLGTSKGSSGHDR
jgi:acyl-coenzyme A synthetase/AMP-(fatty) acid ligase